MVGPGHVRQSPGPSAVVVDRPRCPGHTPTTSCLPRLLTSAKGLDRTGQYGGRLNLSSRVTQVVEVGVELVGGTVRQVGVRLEITSTLS